MRSRLRGRPAIAVVALAAGAVVMTGSQAAHSTPISTATFSGSATSSIVDLANVSLGTTNLLAAQVAQAIATVGGPPAGSAATATNLHVDLGGQTLLNVPQDSLSVSSPPPDSKTGTLVRIPASPILDSGLLSGAVSATWPAAVGTCPSATQPVSDASVTTAGATLLGLAAQVPGAPNVLSTGDATARSTTTLVANGAGSRAVQVQATNTISHIDLLGGSAAGGITITIAQAPVLTGTETGTAATSSVVFTPATGTVTIGASGTPQAITPHLSIPVDLNLGLVHVTGSLMLNGIPTRLVAGNSLSGFAALLHVGLTVSTVTVAPIPSVQLASVNLDVAPLRVRATAPTTGIQCDAATATGIDPNQGPTTGGTTVTITGTCFVAGQTTVTIGGILVPASAVHVAADGKSLTFVTPPHAVGAVQVTVSTPCGVTPPLTYTYTPVPPVITNPGNGSHTGDTTPPIVGTGTPGDTVTVSQGGHTICTGLVGSAGHWNCTPSTPLSCAAHTISATQQAATGPMSGKSNVVTFTVDCSAAPNGLAATGMPTQQLVGIALVLMIGGAFLIASGRLRHRGRHIA